MNTNTEFLENLVFELKDKMTEIKRDEESSNVSEEAGYLLEKYKASMEYFISKLEERIPAIPANNVNENPNRPNRNANNANNNPSGGKRKKSKKTRKHRK